MNILTKGALILFGGITILVVTIILISASLPNNQTPIKSYTSTSETSCVNGKCTTTQYSFTTFTQEDGGWKTLNDVSNFTWLGDRFRLNHRDYSVDIKPFVIYNNQYRDFNDIRNAFPNADLRDKIDVSRFDRKFALNLTVPQNLIDNTQYLGFELTGANNLTWDDVQRKETSLIIKDKIKINFQDILDSHYTLNVVNKTYLLIGNLSANYKNGNLFIDPVITLNDTENVKDIERVRIDGAFQIKWDISSIPTGATLDNATLCVYESVVAPIIANDGDANISRINNQTWGAITPSVADYNFMTTQITDFSSAYLFNSTTAETWWCVNVTNQVKVDYDVSNQYNTLRIEDPDAIPLTSGGVINDITTLAFGSQSGIDDSPVAFASDSYATTSLRPTLTISYTTETNPPTVDLISPANESVYTQYSIENFTWNVTDASTIDYTELWTNFRGGQWLLEYTNGTDYSLNHLYNYSFNFSDWFYSKHIITNQNLSNPTGRALNGNASHFFMTSYQDDRLNWYNRATGENVSKYVLPTTWISDLDNNGTNMYMIDKAQANPIRHTNFDGTVISSCAIAGAGSGALNGIAFDNDNTTLWVVFSGTIDQLRHYTTDCTSIENITLPVSDPQTLDIDMNNLAYVLMSEDIIMVINLTDGINQYNITDIGGLVESPDVAKGVFIDQTDTYPEKIYTTAGSPDELTYIQRRFTGSMIWNAKACDAFGNCAFNATNYTYYFEAPETNCWSYSNGLLTLTPPCLCKYPNGARTSCE